MSDDSNSHDAPKPEEATPQEPAPEPEREPERGPEPSKVAEHDADEPWLLDSPVEEAPEVEEEGEEEESDDGLPELDSFGGVSALGVAIGFLTRLPFGPREATAPGALARSMGLFPLVGVVVGGIGGAVYAAAHLLLPSAAAALLALSGIAWVTGALHEDGLADTADGFGGGKDRAHKLAIMRDSRIGTFGMIALALTLGLRAVALAEIGISTNDFGGSLTVVGALIAAHALSRAAIPVAMQALAPARSDGLGASAGQPGAAQTGIAVTLALVIAALVLPTGAALAALAGVTIGTVLIVLWAQSQIGGHTGDVLGAVEQAAETLALLGVVAAL